MSFIGQTTVATGAPDLVLPDVPCDPSVSVGDWVIMSGGVAIKANASTVATSNVLGLTESKNNSTSANVRVLGVTASLFTGLDESKEYFLSLVSGQMTTTPPTGAGQVLVKVGQPYNSTQFLVLKGSRIIRA